MKKKYGLLGILVGLLLLTVTGTTLAARSVLSEKASLGISIKSVGVQVYKETGQQDDGNKEERGAVVPGSSVAIRRYVKNTKQNGYDVYVKVVIDKKWEKQDGSLVHQGEADVLYAGDKETVAELKKGTEVNGWIVTDADDEQVVMYYKKPLKPGEHSTDFLSEIAFQEQMGSDFSDASYDLSYEVTAVQADNGAAAIAAELGVFAEFDSNGTITAIRESGTGNTASAAKVGAKVQTVTLTADDRLIYGDDSKALQTAFAGMAPGDERTVAIELGNENTHTAYFYVAQKTLDALEEAGKAYGGAYDYALSAGKNLAESTGIFRKSAGGYEKNLIPDTEGLFAVTELENYKYATELAPGEHTNLYLTLVLDGEGMDSARGIDYSDTDGELQIAFGAYYEDGDKTVTVIERKDTSSVITPVVTKASESVTQILEAVKTGDRTTYGVVLACLAAGGGCVIIGLKRRKEGQR